MAGWIALYRSIMEHWVWNTSSKRFQRWVDLLFLASWKDHEVGFGSTMVNLKRGDSHELEATDEPLEDEQHDR